MKVLVIAPHPDDEAIGCGGALLLHAARGDSTTAIFLTSGELGLKHLAVAQAHATRESEARAAAAVLGLSHTDFLRLPDWSLADDIPAAAARLAPLLVRHSPDLVYLPHPADAHPDHRATLPIVRAAIGARPLPPLLGYEIWSPMPEHDHVELITPVMADKLRAIRLYRSQLTEFRYDHAVRGLNQYRGVIAARARYAEVFQSLGGP